MLVQLVPRAQLVKASRVTRVILAHKVHKETRVLKVPSDHKALKV